MAKRKDGKLLYLTGRSRCGKTTHLMRLIMRDRRQVIWDIEGQYAMLPGYESVDGLGALVKRMIEIGQGEAKLAYQPGGTTDKEFDGFCKAAFSWGVLHPCTIVAEEISDVTTPGKAPNGWGILIRRGMKYQIDIYGVSQRPAEADKTILGNASCVIVFAPNTDADRHYLNKRLDIPLDKIPDQQLHYVERFNDGKLKAGKITF